MIRRVATLCLLAGLVVFPAVAQTPTPAPADPIRELLVEVRALRAALERAATVGARIQLLVARVQIQEQRLAELTRRADSIRSEMSSIDQQQTAAALQQTMFGKGADVPPEEREAMEQLMKQFAVTAERLEKRKQELQLEENMVAQQMGLDQGRWSEINSQLDQLERTLTVKQ